VTDFTFLGVPIDSVGRAGGTEYGPAKLRALGLADLCGADAGDLDVRIRGEVRDPVTGILGSAASRDPATPGGPWLIVAVLACTALLVVALLAVHRRTRRELGGFGVVRPPEE